MFIIFIKLLYSYQLYITVQSFIFLSFFPNHFYILFYSLPLVFPFLIFVLACFST